MAVNPFRENSRERRVPPESDMSISAWPSMTPRRPFSAWTRAISTRRGPRKVRNSRATTTIIRTPPTNSAAVNCHPMRRARITPSSMTRFVEANSNAMAAVKSAPLRKIERASATAAYEQDEDAAPRPQAMARDRGESSGSRRVISDFDTTACTAPDRANPRTSAHRISHVIPPVKLSASRISPPTEPTAAVACPMSGGSIPPGGIRRTPPAAGSR